MEGLNELQLIDKANNLVKRREYKEAKKMFAEVLDINPKNVDAYFSLANIFHLQGEIGKAIKAFTKVLELDPSHTDASISLSVLYNDIGKYDEARKIFEVANERIKSKKVKGQGLEDKHINKKFSLKHFELADLYMVYERFDDALFEYNKATALDPENLEARIKVAKVYAKKGFVAKSFEELKKLRNEQPHYIPAMIALGVLYYANGKVLEAQTEWQKALVKDPQNSEAAMYMNLSQTATETSL